ncbi:MAG: hypothetical protein ABSD97_00210 [Acidimicrobiales bacterium]|jgi:hypothetical protein
MTTAPHVPPVDDSPALSECIATFQRHLHIPDPGAVLVALATVAANRAEGDPVWLLLVGPPGGGKTEVLSSLAGLPDIHAAATLTEASLLSGTPAKDKASTAKGGLLREIGDFGIIVAKDFGSVLSMHRETRATLLAALREVYDGSWTRHVGSDGGRTLSWAGKVGFIGGVTPAIDSHHAVMGSLGERFVLFRLPDFDQKAQARRALEHLGSERRMREDLARAVRAVLDAADPVALTAPPPSDLAEELVSLSTLAVKCRSDVERDGYSREILLIPQAEAPARLALVLLRLWNAFLAIGADEKTTRHLVTKCALDSMPQLRRQVIENLMVRGRLSTPAIADLIGYPTSTTRRGCEDLTGHGVLEREPGGQGRPDVWSLAEWARDQWPTVPEMSAAPKSVPEMSEGMLKAQENGFKPKSFTTPLPLGGDNSGTLAARLREFDFDDNDLERMFAAGDDEVRS